eukprot:COSAG02_NODE_5362_length_4398_cov_2.083043_2_plen_65_part_00
MPRAATYGVVEDASARGSKERLLAVVGLFFEGVPQLLVAHGMRDDGKCGCVFVDVRQVCTARDE